MRKKILCKVKQCNEDGETEEYADHMIIYVNGLWRWSSDSPKDPESLRRWELAHSVRGSIFLYKDNNEEDSFRTDWSEDDAFEIRLGNAIANALADLEMDKILTGE